MDILLCYANFNTILKQSQNIRGFGEQKITKYGPFILTTLRDYEKYGKRN
ncbi:hypothetical protein [Clostridium perfringens]|nr:hypothetical protein [Clostridium perfringens]MCX0368132.1 hypothetical protein [Clostridium perfringens]